MFVHSDRLPTGSPLPSGRLTPAPWGLRRMAPYPALNPGYARAELDAATQTTRYFDAAGRPVMMPAHGTSTATSPSTGTSPDGNGTTQDSDSGNDSDQ
ncbi:putative ATP-grasp-modified RiPP [Streptomyces sp. NPDC048629]|uniref:putative ATP-grasp-modified RiPP n=1 Tax=Streptomyces sp. NPDC048629 TaxID=3154824 RepID=UPI0034322C81